MRRSRPVRLLILTAVAAVLPASAVWAQSVGGWPQFQGGAGHQGSAPTGPGAPYRLAWSSPVAPGGPEERFGLSAPVIGGGLAIAVGPEQVVAVDLASGTLAWSVRRSLGPSVTPAVVQSRDGALVLFTDGWGDGPPVVAGTSATASSSAFSTGSPSASPSSGAAAGGSAAGGAAHLVAIGLGDQKERWRVDLPAVSRTGVTIAGDLAIVGTNDGAVTAVSTATGDVAWTADAGGFLEASIAATDTLALVPVRGTRESGTRVLALDLADGEEAWRYEPVTASAVLGPVAVGDDGLAYVAPADATVRAFALEGGDERWTARLNSFVPAEAPVLADDGDVVMADVRSQVYRLDGATGERIWDHAANTSSFRTNPVAVGDTVVLGTTVGDLLAFDLATGDLVGRLRTGDSPIRGLAVTDDVLVAVRAGNDAGLQAFANDPAGALLHEKSPTVLDPGAVALGWLGAALAVVVMLGFVGRLAAIRVAPLDLGEAGDAAGEEETP